MRRLPPDFFNRSATIRPDRRPPKAQRALRGLHEPDIIDAKRAAAATPSGHLPADGGRFELTEGGQRLDRRGQRRAAGAGHDARDRPAGAGTDCPTTIRWPGTSTSTGGLTVLQEPGSRLMVSPSDEPGAITDVDGILVGHHHRLDRMRPWVPGWACGSTVVLAPRAPSVLSTSAAARRHPRETDLLGPAESVREVDAVVLTGAAPTRRRRRRDDLARGRFAGCRWTAVCADRSDRGDFRSTGGRLGVQADRRVRLPGRVVRGSPGRGGHGGRGVGAQATYSRADWARLGEASRVTVGAIVAVKLGNVVDPATVCPGWPI